MKKTTIKEILSIIKDYPVFENANNAELVESLIYSDIPIILEAEQDETKLNLVYNNKCCLLRSYQNNILESKVLRVKN